MMQQRHFEFIARTISGLTLTPAEKRYVAKCFAADLAAQNPRFKRDVFLKACGVGEDYK